MLGSLQTGKELKIEGVVEAYVAGEQNKPKTYKHKNVEIYENEEKITGKYHQ